jgi:ABC-2 type transport system ATP-binding protein
MPPPAGPRGAAVVVARGLTRRYGDTVAVDGLDLEVGAGELFGFLGPNGAGKTTTLRMLAGVLRPSAGEARVAGHSLVEDGERARAALGFVPETPFLYERLSGRESLAFCAGLYGVPREVAARRGQALLRLLELEDAADAWIETYSHGMRQKIALAGALIHDPAALFLDEPTVGLDPRSARTIQDLLRGLCTRGKAVFLSTHALEVAERLCDRVAILDRGRLVAVGTPAELRSRGPASLEELFLSLTGGTGAGDLAGFLEESGPLAARATQIPESEQP